MMTPRMFNKIFWVLLFFPLSLGSVAIAEDLTLVVRNEVFLRRFISLEKIRRGMSREEVLDVFGHEVVIGYELMDPASTQYRPLIAANPYRTETITKKNRNFIVDYYLTGIIRADDRVSDEELLPMVFLNNRLLGLGWEYLIQKIKK